MYKAQLFPVATGLIQGYPIGIVHSVKPRGEYIVGTGQPTEQRRGYNKTVCVVLALALGLAAAVGLFRWRAGSQLRSHTEQIRAAGYPASAAELDQWYSIPEGAENAAEIVLEAASRYKKPARQELLPVVGRAVWPKHPDTLSGETRKLVQEFLAENKETLEILHELVGMEHGRYPVDLSLGLEALMPYLAEIRDLARLLSLDALWYAEENDAEAAVKSTLAVFGLAGSLADEPLITSQLVRFASEEIGVSSIEAVINRAELGDGQLAQLSRAVAQNQDRDSLLRALVGERAVMLECMERPADALLRPLSGRPVALSSLLMILYEGVGLSRRGAVIYVDLVEEVLKALSLPEHRRVPAVKAVEAKLAEIPKVYWTVHMVTPAYSRIVEVGLRNTAHLRVARTALAVERYRLAEGKLPEGLTALAPDYLDAVPKDPFDGQDLRFKRLEKGYVVYSIGGDCSDDGGKQRDPESNRRENWDVTFTVER